MIRNLSFTGMPNTSTIAACTPSAMARWVRGGVPASNAIRANGMSASSIVVRRRPRAAADEGIDEGGGGLRQLPTAVSGTFHHCETSRERHDDMRKPVWIDRRQLVGRGADCFADEVFEPAEHASDAVPHGRARNACVERGARRQATPPRGTARHVHYEQVEEIPQPGGTVAPGQRVPGGFEELPRVVVEGMQKNRFLVAVCVVEAAPLDAGCGGEILHRRIVEPLPEEHIERDRDHFLVIELAHAGHSARSTTVSLTPLSRLTRLSRTAPDGDAQRLRALASRAVVAGGFEPPALRD